MWPFPVTDKPNVQVGNLWVADRRGDYPDNEDNPWYTRDLSEINTIYIHHSVQDNDQSDEDSMAGIYRHHTQGAGWPGIGYNYAVGRHGIYYVGTLETQRAHTFKHNRDGIGVVFLGTFTEVPPTQESLQQAAEFINNLRFGLGANLPVRGHNTVSATVCPGVTVDWLGMYLDLA